MAFMKKKFFSTFLHCVLSAHIVLGGFNIGTASSYFGMVHLDEMFEIIIGFAFSLRRISMINFHPPKCHCTLICVFTFLVKLMVAVLENPSEHAINSM